MNQGTILRTHVLRPTWHLVLGTDLRWMLELSSQAVVRASKGSLQRLGLPHELLSQSRRVFENALERGPKTKDELMGDLAAAGLTVNAMQTMFLLLFAELMAVVVSGPRRGKKVTYDLFDRRVPPSSPLAREEALARLARRYVQGHGPASERDLAWWGGLGLVEARRGLAACRPLLKTTSYHDTEIWYDPEGPVAAVPGTLALPGFDEYIIAFADRTPVVDNGLESGAWSVNGIFHPVVLHEGRVEPPVRSSLPPKGATSPPR